MDATQKLVYSTLVFWYSGILEMIVYQERKRMLGFLEVERNVILATGKPIYVLRLCADVEVHLQTLVLPTTYLKSQYHISMLIC